MNNEIPTGSRPSLVDKGVPCIVLDCTRSLALFPFCFPGIALNICNDHIYGFVPVPLEDNDELSQDYEQLLNVKLEAISRSQPLRIEPLLEPYVLYPAKWKYNCDEIYMINLERRVERRELMERSFRELGMEVKHFKAVDGRYHSCIMV